MPEKAQIFPAVQFCMKQKCSLKRFPLFLPTLMHFLES